MEDTGYVNMFLDFIQKTIDPFVFPPARILEFGSGPGPVLAELLQRKGFFVSLYDPYYAPSTEVLEKDYDMVTSTEVFEHLKDPQKEMELLQTLIQRGAYLAIMTRFHTGKEQF